ncbi:cbb3-type cytochrome oxidase assembly protein CcoS [Helicobacter apodemus]|uniref:Cbb3-type cytochrome oxidase assembly protein CcoS n=1 Tax=Helicobacter apodemus TaxID=135569 RepID=A0A2U8FCI1_9HELI|nr:cbb3-type cytochrome oxidase assembly protein CcoS [Helicobacter apodemus]AWI33932.1 cbb3-type cytochrome oxidase assembly protein CcoS [Helicobacter apodemus]
MNTGMVAIMLATSIIIGLLGLISFIWGLKNGQFDDEKKMMQGVLFDSEEDLRHMANNQSIKKEKNE